VDRHYYWLRGIFYGQQTRAKAGDIVGRGWLLKFVDVGSGYEGAAGADDYDGAYRCVGVGLRDGGG